MTSEKNGLLENNSTHQTLSESNQATILKKRMDIADAVEDYFTMIDHPTTVKTFNQLLSAHFFSHKERVHDPVQNEQIVYQTTEAINLLSTLHSLFRDIDALKTCDNTQTI